MRAVGVAFLVVVVALIVVGGLGVQQMYSLQEVQMLRERVAVLEAEKLELAAANAELRTANVEVTRKWEDAIDAVVRLQGELEVANDTIQVQQQQLDARVPEVNIIQMSAVDPADTKTTSRSPMLAINPPPEPSWRDHLPGTIEIRQSRFWWDFSFILLGLVLIIGSYFQWRKSPTDERQPPTSAVSSSAPRRPAIVARPLRR